MFQRSVQHRVCSPLREAGWCVGKRGSGAERYSVTSLYHHHLQSWENESSASECVCVCVCVCVSVCLCLCLWVESSNLCELFSYMPKNQVRVSCSERDQISEVRVSAVTYIDAVHVVHRTFQIDRTHHDKCWAARAPSTEPSSSWVQAGEQSGELTHAAFWMLSDIICYYQVILLPSNRYFHLAFFVRGLLMLR